MTHAMVHAITCHGFPLIRCMGETWTVRHHVPHMHHMTCTSYAGLLAQSFFTDQFADPCVETTGKVQRALDRTCHAALCPCSDAAMTALPPSSRCDGL